MMPFTTILVANRGEIAMRVIRTARRLGYRTVAVYSRPDAGAPHVAAADAAVLIGPAPVSESYLAIDKVIAAAKSAGAEAIHPGYGLLSENAEFAQACADAEITFIGPPADAIELMGNKRAAKLAMTEAGVPCVPGYQGEEQDDEALAVQAERIGYPVMVKAAAGGGGRGMRLVASASGLADALRGARAEAKSAFGAGELILEKALQRPRHVELQIFGDRHGNYIHLGERDCSIQRRHQKVVEECPSPAVDAELRKRMGQAAVDAARACGYVSAGTVEFLLDADGSFYFLEMNTRLQVEHPVTELVCGVDLVEWQLRVASGEPLPMTQDDVELCGCAIEARLYAEDPAQDFMPQTGQVLVWRPPEGMDVRVDHGLCEGNVISPHYDPMVAKIIAHGKSRDDARRKLSAALRDTTLLGVVTNKAFLANICDNDVFARGEATTAFISEHFKDDPSQRLEPPDALGFAHAALGLLYEGARGIVEDDSFIGWRSGGPVWVTVKLSCGGSAVALQLDAAGRGEIGRRYVAIQQPDDDAEPERVELDVTGTSDGELTVMRDGIGRRLRYAISGDRIWIDDGATVRVYVNTTHQPAKAADAAGSGKLVAPLDGAVMKLFVSEGAAVRAGELILVLEAMKMEHRIEADVDGTVAAIRVAQGDQVKTRQLLVEIEPADGQQRAEDA